MLRNVADGPIRRRIAAGQDSFDEAARAGRFEEMYRLQEQMKSLREEIDALKNHQGVFSQSRMEGGIR